eukprot:1185405-Prorocentrum_minimum.AAC.3
MQMEMARDSLERNNAYHGQNYGVVMKLADHMQSRQAPESTANSTSIQQSLTVDSQSSTVDTSII